METYKLIAIVSIGVLLAALIVLAIIFKKKKAETEDGIIVFEASEDGERDLVRFILNIELDDMKTKKQLVFKVEDHTSQNQQVL